MIMFVLVWSEIEFSDVVLEFVSRADLRWSEGVGDDFVVDVVMYSLVYDENGCEIILVFDNVV